MESDTRLGDTACQFCAALTPSVNTFSPCPFGMGFVFTGWSAALIGGVAAHN